MFHYINTNNHKDLNALSLENKNIKNSISKYKKKHKKLKEKNFYKICCFCLCNEKESDLNFFDYSKNNNYILIKQCLCIPDIHEECLIYYLNNSDKPKCIICKKEMVLLNKNIIVIFFSYSELTDEIKKIIIYLKLSILFGIKSFFNFYIIFQFTLVLIAYIYLFYKNF